MTSFPASMVWPYWLAPLGIGGALVCVLLLSGSLLASARSRVAARSEALRPVPSRTWRLVRGACLLLEPVSESVLPTAWRFRLQNLLRQAGLDQVFSPPMFAAGQLLCGVLMLLVGMFGQLLFGWPIAGAFGLALLGVVWPAARLRASAKRRQHLVRRDLPSVLDLLALALDAGNSLPAAIAMAATRGPQGPMRDELARVLRETHAGRTRQESLSDMVERLPDPGIQHAIAAILAADKHGGDLSHLLCDQAEQRRQERFVDAEQRAMQAPVKLLLPLLAFIFPGTFIVLLFPIVMRIMAEGLF